MGAHPPERQDPDFHGGVSGHLLTSGARPNVTACPSEDTGRLRSYLSA
jgi:hypothetical protein